MIVSIILVILFFSSLIIIHELGHFLTARRNGVTVEEFGIGFPPAIFKFKKGQTVYSINLFMVGGFVRIKGEDEDEKIRPAKDSFNAKSLKVKTKILLAGVAMNLLLAYLFFSALAAFGMPSLVGKVAENPLFKSLPTGVSGLVVIGVNKGSPADRAQIKVGEKIISANGQKLNSFDELKNFNKNNAGKIVTYELITPYSNKIRAVKIQLNTQEDESKGYLGLASIYEQNVRYQLWQAPIVGAIITVKLIWATLAGLVGLIIGLFTAGKVSENVAGPIGITAILTHIQKFGINYLIVMLASISLSLGVINALPIPALDGGRVFILYLNKLGIKISPKAEKYAHIIGFALLILLLIIVSTRDILRLRS
ncbi:MAG: site-2 protease family protein [bacterium]|nr:site-2 protease family protein [bacterium]